MSFRSSVCGHESMDGYLKSQACWACKKIAKLKKEIKTLQKQNLDFEAKWLMAEDYIESLKAERRAAGER